MEHNTALLRPLQYRKAARIVAIVDIFFIVMGMIAFTIGVVVLTSFLFSYTGEDTIRTRNGTITVKSDMEGGIIIDQDMMETTRLPVWSIIVIMGFISLLLLAAIALPLAAAVALLRSTSEVSERPFANRLKLAKFWIVCTFLFLALPVILNLGLGYRMLGFLSIIPSLFRLMFVFIVYKYMQELNKIIKRQQDRQYVFSPAPVVVYEK